MTTNPTEKGERYGKEKNLDSPTLKAWTYFVIGEGNNNHD